MFYMKVISKLEFLSLRHRPLRQLRRVFIYLFIFLLIFIYYLLYSLTLIENESPRLRPKIYLWSNLTAPDDYRCRLPLDINPWDQSIRKYIVTSNPRYVYCPHVSQPEWTRTDANGIVRKLCFQCVCKYWIYRRLKGNDNSIEWLDSGLIGLEGLDLKAVNQKCSENRFLYVNCYQSKSGLKYENNHFWFAPKSKSKSKSKPKPQTQPKTPVQETRRPSVLILVIESLSRLNYLRHMEGTREAFESLGNVFYLRGLTKMADNSHPNMIPFLTGKTVEQFGGRYDKGPFDDYPFIWKQFDRNGYQTSLMEDSYEITLFNELEIGRKGFKREQPVDWYTLPFWRNLIKTDGSTYDNFCYWDRKARVDIFLDQLRHFVLQCRNHSQPYFAFNFYIQVTHVRFNQAKTLDQHYRQLILDLKPIIRNDFVIVMGDHGNRFSGNGFLQTSIGRIEERMPLFGIHIPNSIVTSFPHLSHYLEQNRDQLTTWLDVHRMLTDIAGNHFEQMAPTAQPESYSLWRQPVPANRTCAEALIPRMYCVCDERKRLDTNAENIKTVSLFLVKQINQLLPQICHQLLLRTIITAEEIILHSSVSSQTVPNISRLYELTVQLNHSMAIIRAQVETFSNRTNRMEENDITRLNRYYNQSHCVQNSLFKKLCLCKQF